MCGLAGSVNFKLNHDQVNAVMFHRGPDEQNGFSSGNVSLYHLRLAILDIGGGKQPMQLDNRYTIIFNGEIYNHAELRKQYGLHGKTHSDTETLLMLYRDQGPAFLDHLDGMFVFVIFDELEKRLFIARDRAGKKPLYYYYDGKQLVFASELNCLRNLLPLQLDHDNFYHYTRLGVFYRELTPYKNVTELPGGSYLMVNCDNLDINQVRWWDIHSAYLNKNSDSAQTALDKTEFFLEQGVKRRLESSDLEVGCFLSGGIDSGLVTALASKYNNRIRTFTVSFEGAYNEAPLARQVAEKYHTNHTEIPISFDHLKNDVEQIIANYGEPFFDSSAIPSYYVSREAKKHLTVILNGDGADELFGGYRRYVPFSKYDFFQGNKFVQSAAGALKSMMPAPADKRTRYNYLYRLAALASKSDLEIYLAAGVDLLEDYENNLVDPPANYMARIQADFRKISTAPISGLKKLMNMDFDCNLFSDLLVKMDIATMASSLEGRSPFLCKELLEYVPALPDQFKIKGGSTKHLLRQLAVKYLPPELVNQPKRGFEIPLKNWVEGELNEMIRSYIMPPGAFCRQFVEGNFIDALMENKVRVAPEKKAKIIWMLFCMEVWHKKIYLHA
jgi:asparagine synthase (glutamine-hydrolysing)